ncbi:hypothetical protein [Microvirgula aerodenitrificans]|uniref:hypothetical protein n=1 Tax=Microvirgula aerodenitrificans TaxID=57480 RepID=UPI00248E6480|nr:hypothetical protein [Microvirgula aerodenitrificans]
MKGMENTGRTMASHGANTEAASAMEAGNVRTLAGTLMRELAPSELDLVAGGVFAFAGASQYRGGGDVIIMA